MSGVVIQGNYYIVNSVADTTGTRLAIQYNGERNSLTVEGLVTGVTEQMWAIAHFNGNPVQQTVSPVSDLSLQVAFGSNSLTAINAGEYIWIITEDCANNYTFQDGQQTVYWDIATAMVGENVITESQGGSPMQKWWLYPA